MRALRDSVSHKLCHPTTADGRRVRIEHVNVALFHGRAFNAEAYLVMEAAAPECSWRNRPSERFVIYR